MNEATILAALLAAIVSAVISALTSIAVTKYSLRKAPDYRSQIESLGVSVKKLSETQEQVLQQQVALAEVADRKQTAEEARREASRWRPAARIESTYDGKDLRTELLLKSNEEFALLEVNLLASSGARVAAIPVGNGPLIVRTTGYRVHIPHVDILKIADGDLEYGQTGKTYGKVQYSLEFKSVRSTFELPCRAISDIIGNTVWIRLEG